MLVPVQGGVENLQKRNRMIQMQEAGLRSVELPSIYIFNVGRHEWVGIGAGTRYVIPACKPGESYSKPTPIKNLVLSEIDLADGGNNMGVVMNPALNGVVKIGDDERKVIGVVNDIIGTDSTSPAPSLYTTNGEWMGVFWSRSNPPEQPEIDEAKMKLKQRMELVYSQGAELVQAGTPVKPGDRVLYNEAADILGRPQFWGSIQHTLGQCPECHESIIGGANFCKHCQQAIDPASVAARAKKRQRDAEKLAKDEEATA